MVKVANNYEPTIYNHIFLMAVIRNSANSVSNDRFGFIGYKSHVHDKPMFDGLCNSVSQGKGQKFNNIKVSSFHWHLENHKMIKMDEK